MPGRAAANRFHGGANPAADSGDEDDLTHKVIFLPELIAMVLE